MMTMTARALLVGSGFLGGAIAAELARAGWETETVARAGQHALDLGTGSGRAALHRLAATGGYDLVLLCHGPSDVTWCEENPGAAQDTHVRTAAAVSGTGVATLLISTDNVFPGTHTSLRPDDPPGPANVYGRVKLAAEQAVRAHGGRVIRVSLVYGWSGDGRRRNFAERCLTDLRAGRAVRAPHDQVMTPVYVDDVAVAVAAYAGAPDRELPVVHVAGPSALSRAAFARLAARALGVPEDLVVPVPRAETTLACRPAFSGLASGPFCPDGALDGFQPRDPAAGLAAMLAAEGR